MNHDHPIRKAEEAHTALELFDLAAHLMERVRGDRVTQRTANALTRRLLDARGYQLRVMDRARAQIESEENSHRG